MILQPQIEIDLYSKADPARLIGARFSSIDTGLRLRYEFSRNFAPYIGVVYEAISVKRPALLNGQGRARAISASLSVCASGSEWAGMRCTIDTLLITVLIAQLGGLP